MKSLMFGSILLCVSVLSQAQTITNCDYFNTTLGPFPYGSLGTVGHNNGAHNFANGMVAHCSYQGTTPGKACYTVEDVNSSSSMVDTGQISVAIYKHQPSQADMQGSAGAQGATSATAEGAGAVAQCSILGCNFSVTITPTGLTFGGSTPLWSDKKAATFSCPEKLLPPVKSCPGPPPNGCPPGTHWVQQICACNVSPLIVDTTGNGFRFDAQVTFDLKGNGHPEKYWWPSPDSGNAWLVKIRPGDFRVTSGKQMFRSGGKHANGGLKGHPDPSGFLELAWYDWPAQGGNLDQRMSAQDLEWGNLRLWIDTHCYLKPEEPCEALPSELFTLTEKGFDSLGLVYQLIDAVDSHGNNFRTVAPVNVEKSDVQHSTDPRKVADVYVARVKKQVYPPALPKE